MANVTFITGNQSKADYLSKYLGFTVKHQNIDQLEIQSLDLREVAERKVKQAYNIIKSPVLVEDVSLEFVALGRLPGTFIKFFVDEVRFETICRMLDGLDRAAIARSVYAYYDGSEITFFEASMPGHIAEHPAGNNGFGWDKIFIPNGYSTTRAELDAADYKAVYEIVRPYAELRRFFEDLKYN